MITHLITYRKLSHLGASKKSGQGPNYREELMRFAVIITCQFNLRHANNILKHNSTTFETLKMENMNVNDKHTQKRRKTK